MTDDLQYAVTALARDINNAMNALPVAVKAANARAAPIKAQVTAIEQEVARKARAGVSVNVSSGGLDQRRLDVTATAAKFNAGMVSELWSHVSTTNALLVRAMAMVFKLRDDLAAPEHAAAVAAVAEAERERPATLAAAEAQAVADSKRAAASAALAKFGADNESCRREYMRLAELFG